ncbi:MAG: ATP synthase F1 subunit delta, partial [Actinobacteria bacterium]|nr:ATP synthase F1 subunit delta [Actinomycetota bacterium]
TESVAAQAAFMGAKSDKSLATVEDEIFRFGRIIDASAELQMALTDPSSTPATKAGIIKELFGKKVKPATLVVLTYYASHLRGRRVDSVVDHLTSLAADQTDRIVAEVKSVIDLDAKQKTRLAAVLGKITGKEVRVNVAVDPSIIGGLSIQIGDEVIDGSVTSRLEQARRSLLA